MSFRSDFSITLSKSMDSTRVGLRVTENEGYEVKHDFPYLNNVQQVAILGAIDKMMGTNLTGMVSSKIAHTISEKRKRLAALEHQVAVLRGELETQ